MSRTEAESKPVAGLGDKLCRLGIFAVFTAVAFLPFLNLGTPAERAWTFKPDTLRLTYLLVPLLALAAFLMSFWKKTLTHAIMVAGFAACAGAVLIALALLVTAAKIFGFMMMVPFLWPLYGAGLDPLGPISVLPAQGGWLLLVGTVAAILQAGRWKRPG
jgi:hypothetical protein